MTVPIAFLKYSESQDDTDQLLLMVDQYIHLDQASPRLLIRTVLL